MSSSRPSIPSHTHLARLTAAAVLGVAATAWAVPAADAHVRVFADSTATGSFSALTFRVPNESASAGTITVQVKLPQDTPFLYVSSKPVSGWKVSMPEEVLPKPVDMDGTTITKAVQTVTWSAEQGTRIEPGEYQEFSLSVGPLPAPTTLLLPAVQTYSDGKVSDWSEPTPASGEEPEYPAPELVITAANAAPSASAAPEASFTPAPASPASTTSGASDPVARWLGGAALVVALAGAGVALASRRRRAGS